MRWIFFIALALNSLFGINMPYNYDPFEAYAPTPIISDDVSKEQTKPQKAFPDIVAVLGGRVFANGKWYEVGDDLGEFKLYHIDSKSIVFKYQDKIIALPIGGGSQIVKIKEKE